MDAAVQHSSGEALRDGWQDRPRAFGWMDASRALAAGLVAVSHLRDLLLIDYPGTLVWLPFYLITGFGPSSVIVFFVLSGFWVTKTVMSRASSSHFWNDYLIARLSRLYIVLVPAAVLGGALDWIGSRWIGGQVYERASVYAALTLGHFAGTLVFLQDLFVPIFGSNGPLWSLAYEFWFYLWFPALVLAARRRFSVLALASLVLGILRPALALGFVSWLCGSALYFAASKPRSWLRVPESYPRSSLALSGALFGAVLLVVRRFPINALAPLLAAAFALLMLALCLAEPVLRSAPAALRRFGANRSFSLYAIHYPIGVAMAAYWVRTGRLAPNLFTLGLFCLSALVVLMAASLFGRFTEDRTGDLRKLLHRWTAAVDSRRRPA